MIPFYHFAKDRELESLVPFLRKLVQAEDTRKVVLETFHWDRYLSEAGDPRRLFLRYNGKSH